MYNLNRRFSSILNRKKYLKLYAIYRRFHETYYRIITKTEYDNYVNNLLIISH